MNEEIEKLLTFRLLTLEDIVSEILNIQLLILYNNSILKLSFRVMRDMIDKTSPVNAEE